MNARILGNLVAATAIAFAAGFGGAASAAGVNLVTNGSFETGDFTGWTQSGNTGFTGVQCPGPGPSVSQGICSGFFGPVGSLGFLSQPIATDFDDFYTISFDWRGDGGVPSHFDVSFGGQTLLDLNPAPATGGFQTLNFVARAPITGNSQLQFSFRDDPGFIFLDNVVVMVPEPASMALLGLGLAGLGFVRRRAAK